LIYFENVKNVVKLIIDFEICEKRILNILVMILYKTTVDVSTKIEERGWKFYNTELIYVITKPFRFATKQCFGFVVKILPNFNIIKIALQVYVSILMAIFDEDFNFYPEKRL